MSRAAWQMVSFFNVPEVTANNPFHVPVWCGMVDDRYVEQWQAYWFATPARRRILREALERENEIKRARRGRGRVGLVRRDLIYRINRGRCQICGRFVPRRGFHIEHRLPLSWGGKHTLDNVQIACARCNLKKGPVPRPRKDFWNWYRRATGR